jgi:hypothetical protein
MPLTDEQLNSYELGLRKDADDQTASALGNIGSGYANYGSQSMTNTVNNMNYNRQKQYLDALAARENLAQTWQQTANQKAMTQAQAKQIANENTRGIATLRQQQQHHAEDSEFNRTQLQNTIANQTEQNRLQGLNISNQAEQWRQSHELEKEKTTDTRRQNAIAMHMNMQMQHANLQLQNKQIGMQEWAQKTNAALQQMGLQVDMQKIDALKTPPPVNTSRQDMLTWLSNILQPINANQNANANLELQQQAQQQGISVQQLQNRLALMNLGYKQQTSLINNLSSVGLGLIGAFT